jgi:hypothetical protein
LVVKTAEDGRRDDAGIGRRAGWWQVKGAIWRLHPQPAMRPSVVVAQVLIEDALGMALVSNNHVIEAVSAERADHALCECVGLWSARWSQEGTCAQTANTTSEDGAVDRVSVMDQEARRDLGICDGLDHALGGPCAGWMLGDAQVDDPAAVKSEDHEDVKDAEPRGDHYQEIARPGLL